MYKFVIFVLHKCYTVMHAIYNCRTFEVMIILNQLLELLHLTEASRQNFRD